LMPTDDAGHASTAGSEGFGRVAGPRPPLTTAQAVEAADGARVAVLVEGWSDQAALECLARRKGCALQAEGVLVCPIGGITNLPTFIEALASHRPGLRLAGLCDGAEEAYALRALHRLGRVPVLTRAALESAGFFVCEADLEDVLLRALGVERAEAVVAAEGELSSLRRFQAQPAQLGRDPAAQLRRFIGTRAGRKIRYGARLVEALPLQEMPAALDRALAFARDATHG
jgi:hypothetical protein